MGKAKKVRKFAATKRVLNTTKDTRLKENKATITKAIEQKKEKDGELVREMYIFLDFKRLTIKSAGRLLSLLSI
jgi:hypothetical protein